MDKINQVLDLVASELVIEGDEEEDQCFFNTPSAKKATKSAIDINNNKR